jgi:ABC-type multidrug transport system ATPase subunit
LGDANDGPQPWSRSPRPDTTRQQRQGHGVIATPVISRAAATAVLGLHVEAAHASVTARSGRRLLDDATLDIAPGSLVAIVGASGAGKSTLLDVLAGVRRPSTGGVHYDGADVAEHRSAFRTVVGYVPQDDIVHRELDVRATLVAAARLRIPGVSAAEVKTIVVDALRATGLSDRADVRVGSLSGGQRKRASIAAELLTRPRGLFLDEPTSGLDPATADDLMRTLRALADGGTTVVLTTHRGDDLASCDRVVTVVAGVVDMTSGPSDDHAPPTRPSSDPSSTPAPAPVVRGATQWAVLVRRNVALLRANRLTLAITLGSPAAVIAMFLVLFRPGAFDPSQPDPTSAGMIVFWAAFAAFFFGLTSGLLQVCTELAIVRRERLAGLGVLPYLLAKLTVLVPMLALTIVAMVAVLRALDRFPALDTSTTMTVLAVLVLDAIAATTIGLLASTAVTEPSHATLALPMICFPAVLFSGGVLPVASMAAAGRFISIGMPDRWAFEGLARLLDVQALGGDRATSPLAQHGDAFTGGVGGHAAVMAIISLAALGATTWLLSWRATDGRR